mmetsp:Transcript_22859/g.35179  ORF Transcript_22859/g.35179 Transcript_22859/m.35179 type:complete len:167 (-) Transcript_22859:776-1276(-)
MTVSTSQFRCRELFDTKLFLYTPNDPIIESSSGLELAPYNFKYPLLKEHADYADIVGKFTDDEGIVQDKVNKWDQVYDFTPNKEGPSNHQLTTPDKFSIVTSPDVVPDTVTLDPTEHMDFIFELPIAFGGTLADVAKAKDSLMAFDITTGAQAAQAMFNKNEAEKL